MIGKAVALDHLVLRRHREGDAEIDQPLQEIVGQIVAMDDVDVGTDEAGVDQLLPAAWCLRRAAALMHRGDQAELARQPEIMHGHVERRIMRTENGKPERDQAVAVGEGTGQQPLDLAARMRHFREMRLARLRLRLWRAVEEGGADAALDQAAHGGVGMGRRRIVVAPVDQRGGAAIDLVQRADEGGDVDVVRAEQGREPGMHAAEIFEQRPVRSIAAQRRLPGVHMRVDEPGDDDAAATVDDLGISGVDAGTHLGDPPVLDQHVADTEIADRSVHADDRC